MSYKIHEENKRKIGQERSSMQQAHYQCHRPTPWMQESVSMHKSPTHLKHSLINQARSEEEEKERKRKKKGRGKRKEEEKERQENWGQEADGKKGSPTKQNTSEEEELKQGLPGTAKVNKAGGGTPNFPSHRMRQNHKNELISNESIFEYPGNLKFIF